MCLIKRAMYLLLFCTVTLASAQGLRVADIRVEGLQRVSAGTVFASLPVNVGDTLDPNQLQELTRELFSTGYFDDIKISYDEGVLVIDHDGLLAPQAMQVFPPKFVLPHIWQRQPKAHMIRLKMFDICSSSETKRPVLEFARLGPA